MNGVRIVVVRDPSPERVRECVAALSPEERQTFSRMKNPREADVRAVLRAEANRLRDSGAVVSVSHAGDFGVLVSRAKTRSREDSPVTQAENLRAFASSRESLGVDCEPWAGEIPDDPLVREIASEPEFAAWRNFPKSEKRRAFVRLWTLKEAGFKAGIAATMRDVPVAPDFSCVVAPAPVSQFADVSPEYAVAVVWRAVGGDPE